jgi:hypothetical protein
MKDTQAIHKFIGLNSKKILHKINSLSFIVTVLLVHWTSKLFPTLSVFSFLLLHAPKILPSAMSTNEF